MVVDLVNDFGVDDDLGEGDEVGNVFADGYVLVDDRESGLLFEGDVLF